MKPHRRVPKKNALSPRERELVRVGLAGGDSFRVIARRLGRAPSTVSREVKANGGRDRYEAFPAQARAEANMARPRPCWTVTRPQLWAEVQSGLRQRWSPQQIAVRLRVEHPGESQWWVSHESIYQAIFVQARGSLRKELAGCLRSGRTTRRPQSRAGAARQGPISNMVMISERPPEADDRAVPGHWEGDLIIGRNGKSAVATLVERATRYGHLIAIEDRTAEHVAERLAQRVQTLPDDLKRSLTWDQGSEMAAHADFTITTGVPVYFCDPHSPWLRGSNENFNGLVRQFLPKGTDLSVHTQDDLDEIADMLNGRPRQTLGWMKPCEALTELLR